MLIVAVAGTYATRCAPPSRVTQTCRRQLQETPTDATASAAFTDIVFAVLTKPRWYDRLRGHGQTGGVTYRIHHTGAEPLVRLCILSIVRLLGI